MRPTFYTRIVEKDGTFRVKHFETPPNFRSRIRDFFNVLLETRWRWVFLTICLPFPATWFLYASLYYLTAWHHGDFEPVIANQTDHEKCVGNSIGFLSMFLFSLESETTIGYGYRYMTESCPIAICLLCLQYLTGAILEACSVSLIWIRLIRPKSRARQIIFSRYAVIKPDEHGRPCFRIRLFDTSSKYLVQTWIRLYYVQKRPLEPGSSLFTFDSRWMDLGQLYGKEKLLLLWPVEVVHVIDQTSPLYRHIASTKARTENDFEIIAVVEGVVEASGLVTQSRTSYTPDEIKWDHEFVPITYSSEKKNHNILSTELDNIVPIPVHKDASDNNHAITGATDHHIRISIRS